MKAIRSVWALVLGLGLALALGGVVQGQAFVNASLFSDGLGSDRIVTKDMIISHVWDYDADILPNTVEVYIGYLRKKIDRAYPNKPQLVRTIRGFGYRLGSEEPPRLRGKTSEVKDEHV